MTFYCSVKIENGCGGTSTLNSFSPNLFYSTGPICPTYLIQAEKGGGSRPSLIKQASRPTKLNGPSFHHNQVKIYAAKASGPKSSKFLLSRINA